jgi:putative transposase
MDFTQEQISELLTTIANKKDGYRILLQQSLEAIMRAERSQFNEVNTDYGNGYRFSKVCVHNGKMELMIPRSRNHNFYPLILALIKDQNKESEALAFELYKSGLTTEQVGKLFGKLYDHHYSKSAISQMMQSARQDVFAWLDRKGLDTIYPVIYIDATFWPTRRENEVSNEAYYTILGVKQDTTREVLSIVNHPTEGSSNWEDALNQLKQRGVEKIELVVVDGLNGIEDVINRVYPEAKIQLCTVHLARNIVSKVKPVDKPQVVSDLKTILDPEQTEDSLTKGIIRFNDFVKKWQSKYPSFKQYLKPRYSLYFTYLNYEKEIRRMIYTTNWIERLNRNYKRTLRMRSSMPSPESVLFLLGSVSMDRLEYRYPIYQFKLTTKLSFLST